MEKETWKPVVGYEGLYEVSDWGRVKSLNFNNTGKEGMLKPNPNGKGYLCVGLCNNGNQETCKVHILVMRAFVGECPEGYEVDHYDWNPENNMLENLSYQPKGINRARRSPEWKKNQAEAVRKTLSKPVNQYTLDGEYVKTWESATDAARELGLSQGHISSCCNGKRENAGGFIWKLKEAV